MLSAQKRSLVFGEIAIRPIPIASQGSLIFVVPSPDNHTRMVANSFYLKFDPIELPKVLKGWILVTTIT